MPVFRVEKTRDYTVMANHHLKNKELTLKAKGLLSVILSLPEDWDYTLKGLSHINREGVDAIREAVRELERAGYVQRSRNKNAKGQFADIEYVIYEQPRRPYADEEPASENQCWKIQYWITQRRKSLCREIPRWRNLRWKIPHN